MNKKFLTAFLFGAAVLASTSTFVSCKDYSDEISDLQEQINSANALHATKAELAEAKTALTAAYQAADAELKTAIEALKKASEEGDQDLQNALKKEADRAIAAEAALEGDIEKLQKADEEINKLIKDLDEKKLDKTAFDEKVKEIYTDLAALDTKLSNKLTEEVGKLEAADAQLKKDLEAADKALDGKIDANKTAIDALKKDYEQQKEVCQKYEKKVDDILADYLTSKDKKELQDNIDKVKKDLEDAISKLTKRVETNEADIKTLKEDVKTLKEAVAKINEELVALNILVKTSLRSLVFVPDSYYWGVEATSVNYLEYNAYEVTKADIYTEEDNTKMGGTEVRGHEHGGKVTEGSKVLDFAAKYHLNPSSANLEGAKFALVTGDRDYVRTYDEADALLSIKGTPTAANGILTVALDVQKPELIKSVPVNDMVTVFATQVTLPKDGEGAKADTTITSDYATVYKSYITDLVMSHVGNYPIEEGDVIDGEFSVPMNYHCGYCEYYKHSSGEETFIGNHLYATAKEITEDLKNIGQDTCNWNATLDLTALVETHYTDETGSHMLMTAQKLSECGLKYNFELVGYYQGGNETSESVHAALKVDEKGHTIFHPQMPDAAGKQQAYDDKYQSNSSVGRTPLVRVTLVDTESNAVYDYGYLMIRITRPGTTPRPQDVLHKDYTFTPGVKYSYECAPADWKDSLKWNQVESDILYELLDNMAKDEFDEIYTLDVTNGVANQYNPAKSYEAWTGFGEIIEKFDAEKPETSVLKWTVLGSTIEALSKDNTALKTAVRYVPNNKTYPVVYIVFETAISRSDAPKATGIEKKNANYWYATDKQTQGTDEVHTNVLSPEDKQSDDADNMQDGVSTAVKFDYTCVDVFTGDVITIAGIEDPTKDKEYADSKLTKNIIFSDKNNGKIYKGLDNKDYKTYNNNQGKATAAEAKADAKTLYATADSKTYVAIAVITGDYPDTKVEYLNDPANHDEVSDLLLNYKAYNALDANTLTAYLELEAKNACHTLPIDDAIWNVRFLRPINVEDNSYKVQDAGQADQKINLRDLIKCTDWRGVWTGKNTKDYWSYYNITSIEVLGAEAGKNIAGVVTTDMDGGTLGTTTLKAKNENAIFEYQPTVKTHGAYGTAESYGYIRYQNLSNTVQTFKIQIPVKVCYQWGYVISNVTVTVDSTLGGGAKLR